ncbi:isoprenylcysteine carboxylmethyltransferase family protein [Clostridium sp.]|uniref:methyltransferase family protein n=1 Tax=Clostridium sp. TaxID=1506 RepID=UPI00284E9343|nr:isoprenylcysteine carboxylmethyltransferase family protein [Clostridium sp.]MDR3595609.1 isoprenylcysteine carboxylmethyltransferase family protein [Clostridium sp.]
MNLIGNSWFVDSLQKFSFQIVFILWVVSEIGISLFTILKPFEKNSSKKSFDNGSYFAIIFGVWISVWVSFLIKKQAHWLLPNIAFWIGIAFMFLGIVFRCWAVWILRKFFSLSVVIESEHKLVKNGPYKYLRHPAYTGSIITLLGIPFSLRTLTGILLVGIIVAIAYGYRIFVEEKALLKNFGDEYVKYSKHTWRIIPWIW